MKLTLLPALVAFAAADLQYYEANNVYKMTWENFDDECKREPICWDFYSNWGQPQWNQVRNDIRDAYFKYC